MNPLSPNTAPFKATHDVGAVKLGNLSNHKIEILPPERCLPSVETCWNQADLAHSLTDIQENDQHLSDTMAAHVLCNDRLIEGTHLEGNIFTNSMDFGANELKKLASGKYTLGVRSQDVAKAQVMVQELNHCKQTLERIYQIASMPIQARENALSSLQSSLLNQIQNLAPGNKILLPGGWTGQPGHAMLYEVQRGLDGNFIFHLYNSGDGLSYHPRRQSSDDSTKYLCHLQWNLGPASQAQSTLKQVLPQLLKLRTVGKDANWKTGSEHLYEGIVPKLEALGAKRYIPHSSDPCWMSAQKAGICTWQSIQVWQKANLSPQTYKGFKLCTKINTLRQYAAMYPDRIAKDKLISNVMQQAVNKLNHKLQEYGLATLNTQVQGSEIPSHTMTSHSDRPTPVIHYISARPSANVKQKFIDFGRYFKTEKFKKNQSTRPFKATKINFWKKFWKLIAMMMHAIGLIAKKTKEQPPRDPPSQAQ